MAKLPVLVLAYNRPDFTRGLMEKLEAYAPVRLYVACDGPRLERSEDSAKVAEVRRILSSPNWETSVFTRFPEENLGLREAVRGAIDWFFENEEEGIILEDDCWPHPDFFRIAEHVISKYERDDRVWGMTGSNVAGVRFSGEASYGFLGQPLIWGWASWANRWKQHDPTLGDYRSLGTGQRNALWPSPLHKLAIKRHLDSMVRWGVPNTWDYPWAWTVMSRRGLWVVPAVNLIENVGIGPWSTNTKKSKFPAAPVRHLESNIRDPREKTVDLDAEESALYSIHGLSRPLWTNYPIAWLKIAKKSLQLGVLGLLQRPARPRAYSMWAA